MKKIAISIPTPCHENWQNMNPTEQGRYCSSCKKEVIDFSVLTDLEIVHHLKKTKGEACGSFLPEQLDRSIEIPKQSSFSWKYFFQILLPAFLISQKPQAQTLAPSILKTDTISNSIESRHITITLGGIVLTKRTDKIINGEIIDSATGNPIPSSTIKIKGSNTGTSADSIGLFSLKRKNEKPVTLIITSVGFKTKEINVNYIYQYQTIKLTAENKTMDTVVLNANVDYRRLGGAYMISTKTTYYRRIKDTLSGKNYFNIYPNPVTKNSPINIKMSGVQQGEFLLQLTNVQGNMMQQEKIQVPATNFTFQLDLKTEIISGAYFLKIISPDKKLVHSSKIIVL